MPSTRALYSKKFRACGELYPLFYTKGNPVGGETVLNVFGVKNWRQAAKKNVFLEDFRGKNSPRSGEIFLECFRIQIRREAAKSLPFGTKSCLSSQRK